MGGLAVLCYQQCLVVCQGHDEPGLLCVQNLLVSNIPWLVDGMERCLAVVASGSVCGEHFTVSAVMVAA